MKLKKIIFTAFALSAFLLTSCTKNVKSIDEIIFSSGKWKMVLEQDSASVLNLENGRYIVPSKDNFIIEYSLLDPSNQGGFLAQACSYEGTIDCTKLSDKAFEEEKSNLAQTFENDIIWNERTGRIEYSSFEGEALASKNLSVSAMKESLFPTAAGIIIKNFKLNKNKNSTSYTAKYTMINGDYVNKMNIHLFKLEK